MTGATRRESVSDSQFQVREKTLQTIFSNGRKLEKDGYTILPTNAAYVWRVNRPGCSPTRIPEGGTVTGYYVRLEKGTWECDCSCCSQWAICKHIIGVQLFLARSVTSLFPAADMSDILAALCLTVSVADPEPFTPTAAPILSHSGRQMERRDPREYQLRSWPKYGQKERTTP